MVEIEGKAMFIVVQTISPCLYCAVSFIKSVSKHDSLLQSFFTTCPHADVIKSQRVVSSGDLYFLFDCDRDHLRQFFPCSNYLLLGI